ncbi:MAG: hypothetical protein ACJAQW_001919, partial [Paracoccaceae bacterium]
TVKGLSPRQKPLGYAREGFVIVVDIGIVAFEFEIGPTGHFIRNRF